MKQLTVIIPTYNRPEYLKRVLTYLEKQDISFFDTFVSYVLSQLINDVLENPQIHKETVFKQFAEMYGKTKIIDRLTNVREIGDYSGSSSENNIINKGKYANVSEWLRINKFPIELIYTNLYKDWEYIAEIKKDVIL